MIGGYNLYARSNSHLVIDRVAFEIPIQPFYLAGCRGSEYPAIP